jgi:hypothetical protein
MPGRNLAFFLLFGFPNLTFTFPDFTSTKGLVYAGNAARAGKVLRLTPAKMQKMGATWFADRQPVANGFETTFQFQLTHQGGLGNGADGFAFVLQNSGRAAIGGRGNAGGFAVGDGLGDPNRPGIPKSLAVFFDTYRNPEDPSDNYITICTNGRAGEMHWPPSRLAYTRDLNVFLKDRAVHSVRILYRPPVLSVFLDDAAAPALESAVDRSIIADSDGSAWVGFTASTGGGYENHDILNWSFSAAPKSDVSSNISFLTSECLPDRNLCTPGQAVVEEIRPGEYHVVLPANREWGTSIPNASGKTAAVSNTRGTVCWDLKTRGPDGCSALAGNGAAGAGFLAPDQKAGALISKSRDGRIYFSVNDRSGNFRDNEGYFEFDVKLEARQ